MRIAVFILHQPPLAPIHPFTNVYLTCTILYLYLPTPNQNCSIDAYEVPDQTRAIPPPSGLARVVRGCVVTRDGCQRSRTACAAQGEFLVLVVLLVPAVGTKLIFRVGTPKNCPTMRNNVVYILDACLDISRKTMLDLCEISFFMLFLVGCRHVLLPLLAS